MIWATVCSQSCFWWLYRASPSFCKEYNQSDFGIDHLVMPICRVFSCVVGRRCLLRPVRFLGKILLAFALLYFVLKGQICLILQGIAWLPNYLEWPFLTRACPCVGLKENDVVWESGLDLSHPLSVTSIYLSMIAHMFLFKKKSFVIIGKLLKYCKFNRHDSILPNLEVLTVF